MRKLHWKWQRTALGMAAVTATLAFLLSGCGAEGASQDGAEVAPTTEAEPPLATVAPSDAPAEAAPALQAPENSEAGSGEQDQAATAESGQSLVAPSGSVNLGDLPADGAGQESEAAGELRVAPAPGVPDPGLVMSNRARQDLAGRLGIDISQIEVVEVETVTWPDSSLGCPAEDTGYLQVLTPGYQVTLSAQGEAYVYHTDSELTVVLCRDGRPVE